jgi:hypothetical protein
MTVNAHDLLHMQHPSAVVHTLRRPVTGACSYAWAFWAATSALCLSTIGCIRFAGTGA